uniref:Uncharacterized protein n=1 Tax=Panagrolaimus superbus TaxID=310955 RepID=A0A914YK21_9BILA
MLMDEFEKLKAAFDAQGAKLQAKFDAQAAKQKAEFDASEIKHKHLQIKYQKLENMVKSARETLGCGGGSKSACSKPSGPMGFTFGQGNGVVSSELQQQTSDATSPFSEAFIKRSK